ncbi:MAG: hypothetical protein P4L35_03585 [Ignavibacteriaceae bacterium]|nr:hypothetical protein [Ignavibacteriaceae bacterium]
MSTIYIRTLKHVENTVFCVQNGQKTYFDPVFRKFIPYSSGQQVKRSLIDSLNRQLNSPGSPTTFMWDVNKKKELKEGEVFGTCDPSYADQLFGGWMRAAKGGEERTLKRRSPLSISSMRAIHPLLANVNKEDASFDRSDRPNNKIIVRNENGSILTDEEVVELLEGKDRSLSRKWIPENARATGLFVQDIAIDLRRLFSVSLNHLEPEISSDTEKKLRDTGWIESINIFGQCLIAPESIRDQWIPALVKAIIDWKITSNQARTFSLMETLALTVSNNANKTATSIRAKLMEDEKAKIIIEESLDGVDTFVTLPAAGYTFTNIESASALEQAEQRLITIIKGYNYQSSVNN